MLLNEALSSQLYHYTPFESAISILGKRKLGLRNIIAAGTERFFASRKKYFYISFARSRYSSYIQNKMTYSDGVILNINGDWLNQKNQGKPVNFWTDLTYGDTKSSLSSKTGGELEDRIISDKPYIDFPKKATDLIQEIHVSIKTIYRQKDMVKKLLELANKNNIPIYFYSEPNLAIKQDKSKAMSLQTIKNVYDIDLTQDVPKYLPRINYRNPHILKPWLELIYKNDFKKLSDKAKSLSTHMDYKYGAGLGGNLQSYDVSRADAHKIIKWALSKGMDDTDQINRYLYIKWNELNGAEPGPQDLKRILGENNTGLNLSRNLLPQVGIKHHKDLMSYLKDNGINYTLKTMKSGDLKPSQGEFDTKKIRRLLNKSNLERIIISQDNYILDGHHRWAACCQESKNKPLKVLSIELPILDLIKLVQDFREHNRIDIIKENIKYKQRIKINI